MPRKRWSDLETGPHGPVVRALRQIVKVGYHRFDAADVKPLSLAFADDSGPADAGLIRERLRDLLMESEPANVDLDQAYPDGLSVPTRINVLLFRVPTATMGSSLDSLRDEAGVLARPENPIAGGGFRKPGGREYYLIKELAETIAGRTRPRPGEALHGQAADPGPWRRQQPKRATRPKRTDAHDLFSRIETTDLDKGFWWRTPTVDDYIELLADRGNGSITVYAGADGPADVGPPLHRDLLHHVLLDELLTGEFLDDTPNHDRAQVADAVVTAVASCLPSAYVGSIVRELFRTRAARKTLHSETRLAIAIGKAIDDSRTAQGFVASAIDFLALTLRQAGHDVTIISAHFDMDIASEVKRVHDQYPELRPFELVDCEDRAPLESPAVHQISLLRLHGRRGDSSMQPLVVGEADFIADEAVDGEHVAGHVSRSELLLRALREGTVVFVGSSLDEPGVLAGLAATKHAGQRRFAVLLPPDLGPQLDALKNPSGRAVALSLIAQRYLHLGVVPIILDFEQQVPQLLREVALRLLKGASYVPLRTRLLEWWVTYAQPLGYDQSGRKVGYVNAELRKLWRQRLVEKRRTIEGGSFLGANVPGTGDDIKIEVWLRNHLARKLFLLATSDRRAPSPGSSPQVAVLDYGANGIVQRTFRAGRTLTERHAGRRWQYVIATPLVLHGEPWHHLPVGVVTVMSNRAGGSLFQIRREPDRLDEFTTNLTDEIRPWLEHAPSDASVARGTASADGSRHRRQRAPRATRAR
jgi:hypothetical protein